MLCFVTKLSQRDPLAGNYQNIKIIANACANKPFLGNIWPFTNAIKKSQPKYGEFRECPATIPTRIIGYKQIIEKNIDKLLEESDKRLDHIIPIEVAKVAMRDPY